MKKNFIQKKKEDEEEEEAKSLSLFGLRKRFGLNALWKRVESDVSFRESVFIYEINPNVITDSNWWD